MHLRGSGSISDIASKPKGGKSAFASFSVAVIENRDKISLREKGFIFHHRSRV